MPSSSVHVQLPCSEHYFQVDMAVETPHLHTTGSSTSELPMSNFQIRLLDVRSRILQYVCTAWSITIG